METRRIPRYPHPCGIRQPRVPGLWNPRTVVSSACFRPRDSSRHGIPAQEKWKLHSSPWSRSVQRGWMCGETGGKGNSLVRAERVAQTLDLDSPAEWVGVGANSVFVATQSEVRLYDTDGAFERALERVDGPVQ